MQAADGGGQLAGPGPVGGQAQPGSCLHGEFQLVDAGRGVDFQGPEDVALGFRELGTLAEGAGRAGEGADVDAAELAAQLGPGPAGGVIGDPAEDGSGSSASLRLDGCLPFPSAIAGLRWVSDTGSR